MSPPVSKEAKAHPDLYAAEFVRRLLTQDYGAPRDDLLAWVQAESAQTSEPLIVGLIPEDLRPKWAVFSVSDPVDGSAPIPGVDEWSRLAAAGASTTARVQRVSEPLGWTNAVEAGRITDPGVTARVVSAEVIRHTSTMEEVYSVEISLELEGPPVRADWGFVGAATYTVVPMGHR